MRIGLSRHARLVLLILAAAALPGCNSATVNALQSGVPFWQIAAVVLVVVVPVAAIQVLYPIWRQSSPNAVRFFESSVAKLIGVAVLGYASYQVYGAFQAAAREREHQAAYCAVVVHSLPDWVLVGVNRGEMTPEMYGAIRRAMDTAQRRYPSDRWYLDCDDFERRGTDATRARQRELFRAYERERLGMR